MREIETLTALRGVAALWIVLYHYALRFPEFPGRGLIAQGDVAVDVFFTLSGFILVYVYRAQVDIGPFLLRRFARLYPVHLATLMALLALIGLSHLAGQPMALTFTAGELLAHLAGLQAWGVMDRLTLNYPSWSISAEIAAYLLFPLLAATFLRARLAIVLPLAVAFFALCLWIAQETGRSLWLRTYDMSLLRILREFIFGMLAARLAVEGRLVRLPVAILGALLFGWGLHSNTQLAIILAAPCVIAALYLYDREMPAPLRYLGLISYSLYMVHALVEKVGFQVFEMALGTQSLPVWSMLLVTLIAILVAAATYHWIEKPGRKLVLDVFGRAAPRPPAGAATGPSTGIVS